MSDFDWQVQVLLHGHNYDTERARVAELIKDMSVEEMQEFAKSYEATVWCPRIFPGLKPARRFMYGEAGSTICEVGESTPLIYIGSVSMPGTSVRLVLNTKKRILQKAHNVRSWDQRQTKKLFVVLFFPKGYENKGHYTTVTRESKEEITREFEAQGYQIRNIYTGRDWKRENRIRMEHEWMSWT